MHFWGGRQIVTGNLSLTQILTWQSTVAVIVIGFDTDADDEEAHWKV